MTSLIVFGLLAAGCTSAPPSTSAEPAEPDAGLQGPPVQAPPISNEVAAAQLACADTEPNALISLVMATNCLQGTLTTQQQACITDMSDGYSILVDRSRSISRFDVIVNPEEPERIVPTWVVDRLAAIEGVEATGGEVFASEAVPIDLSGEPFRPPDGAALLSGDWPSFARNSIVTDGRAPATSEFGMSRSIANAGGFTLGDKYQILAPSGSETFTLVALFDFDAERTGALYGIAFDEAEAARFLNGDDGYNQAGFLISGDPATTFSQMKANLAGLPYPLTSMAERRAAEDAAAEEAEAARTGMLAAVACLRPEARTTMVSAMVGAPVDDTQAYCVLDGLRSDIGLLIKDEVLASCGL